MFLTDYPLLPTPKSQDDSRPRGFGGGGDIVTPSRARQRERIGPEFRRLQAVIDGRRDMVSLRDDPAGIAPERVIMYEVAGSQLSRHLHLQIDFRRLKLQNIATWTCENGSR